MPRSRIRASYIAVWVSVFLVVLLFVGWAVLVVAAHGGHTSSFAIEEAIATVLFFPGYALGALNQHAEVPDILYISLIILAWLFTGAFWASVAVTLVSACRKLLGIHLTNR